MQEIYNSCKLLQAVQKCVGGGGEFHTGFNRYNKRGGGVFRQNSGKDILRGIKLRRVSYGIFLQKY